MKKNKVKSFIKKFTIGFFSPLIFFVLIIFAVFIIVLPMIIGFLISGEDISGWYGFATIIWNCIFFGLLEVNDEKE